MRRSAGGATAFDTPPHLRSAQQHHSPSPPAPGSQYNEDTGFAASQPQHIAHETPFRSQLGLSLANGSGRSPVEQAALSTSSSSSSSSLASGHLPHARHHKQHHSLNLGSFDADSAEVTPESGLPVHAHPNHYGPTSPSLSSRRFRSYNTDYLHHRSTSDRGGDDNLGDDGDGVVRNYESGGAVLPTYSPASSQVSTPRLRSSAAYMEARTQSPTRHASVAASASPRRYGNSGTYHAYGPSSPDNGGDVAGTDFAANGGGRGGEDKMAEKASFGARNASFGSYPAEKAGYPRTSSGKYANLIPEQRPPRSSLDYVTSFFDNEACVIAMYTVLSLITRLWKIGKNASVVWDEAHFGKFGSHYLKHEFYFDVHPPLGKMLVGLAGLLSGYGGQFEFKSGEAYPQDVNYVGMRIMLAMFGVAMVPIAYSTSGALGWNWRARHLLALMVLCDNAWLVISRFILLDSMLLFFTFTTVLGLVMFNQYQRESFSDMWWFWITFTGVSIGCVARLVQEGPQDSIIMLCSHLRLLCLFPIAILQRQVGRTLCHSTCRPVHDGRSLEQVWRLAHACPPLCPPLVRSYPVSHRPALECLHGDFQDALHDP